MDNPGFEKIIDCSGDISCFRTLNNSEHQFSKIQERTMIESRQIAHNVVDISQLTRLAIGKMHVELGKPKDGYSGLVLSSSNTEEHAGGLDKVAEGIANLYGIPKFESLNYACSGFPAAVEAAIAMGKEDPDMKRILVVTAEKLSEIVDYSDENTSVLFGDGVAISSIVPNGKHQIIDAWARGNIDDPKKCLRKESKVGTKMADGSINENDRDVIVMDGGRTLYKTVPQSLLDIACHTKVGPEGIDYIVPHQANGKFISYMERLLQKQYPNIDIEIIGTIAHHANSASASIPRALASSIDRFESGKVVACPAKGAGINYEEGKLTEGLVLFKVG
ncbi:hypothetical protein HOL63_04520 [Candidatus Peregrinibacteria bacterium]|nr:hypothetical protein [Candidatus Peregrinibacteria bacterium]